MYCVITAWPHKYAIGLLAPAGGSTILGGSPFTSSMINASTFESTLLLHREVSRCTSGTMWGCVQNVAVTNTAVRLTLTQTDCPPPLLPPTDITVNQFGDSLTEARISWAPPPNASRLIGYRVMYNYSVIEFIGNDTSAIVPGESTEIPMYDGPMSGSCQLH